MQNFKLFLEQNLEYKFINQEDYPDEAKDAEKLAKIWGINILRGKELYCIVLDSGKMVAGLWTELDNDEFSFDIAVSPNYRHNLIGIKLVDIAMKEFKNLNNSYNGEFKLINHVVNPGMIPILMRYGLVVVQKTGTGTVMMDKESAKKWFEDKDFS